MYFMYATATYVVPNTLPVGDVVMITTSTTGNVLGATNHKL
jgi:hypothetical protein